MQFTYRYILFGQIIRNEHSLPRNFILIMRQT